MAKQQTNNLIQILFSSFFISHFTGEDLSITDLAVDLTKLDGSYQNMMDGALEEFDGKRFEEAEGSLFKRRLELIENKIDDLVEELKIDIPEPTKVKEAPEATLSYVEDPSIKDNQQNPIVAKWMNRFASMGGNIPFKFDSDDLNNIKKKLFEIAKLQIKYLAMKQVKDEAALEGVFQFHKDFQSVPDACKYYRKQLGDKFSRKLLKEKIKRYAHIYEDSKVLENWSTINKRINSWVQHEENKYN